MASSRVAAVRVDTSRFGEVEVDETSVLRFPHGLLGLESEASAMVLLEREDGPYHWLQSTTAPDIAMVVTDPWLFFPDYEFDVPDEVQDELGLESTEAVRVMVIVTVVQDGDRVSATANLLGPLVVNVEERAGRQLVLEGTDYTTREPVA